MPMKETNLSGYNVCLQQAFHPTIGDYWNEMFNPIAVVVDVDENNVTICTIIKSVGKDSWTWDLDELKTIDREKFSRMFCYSGDINRGFYADVMVAGHEWVNCCIHKFNNHKKAELYL